MIVLLVMGMISLVVGYIALIGWVVMSLWNWIMPYLFNLPTIEFWMALGIILLAGFIFHGSNQIGKQFDRLKEKK